MSPVRLASLDALADPGTLEPVLGPVEAVERSPLTGVGFSGSRHERLEALLRSGERRRLVLKRTALASDWTAYRSGDLRGREAALFEEPVLAGIWDVFACPYLAYATEAGEVGLLMEDLRLKGGKSGRQPWCTRGRRSCGPGVVEPLSSICASAGSPMRPSVVRALATSR